MKYIIAFFIVGFSMSCSEKDDTNELGCGTGINDAGARILVKCLTKAQFNNRANIKDPVTAQSIFEPYSDVQWELCDNCK
jgi:hypothetical protein